jgi:hypothetical protein
MNTIGPKVINIGVVVPPNMHLDEESLTVSLLPGQVHLLRYEMAVDGMINQLPISFHVT